MEYKTVKEEKWKVGSREKNVKKTLLNSFGGKKKILMRPVIGGYWNEHILGRVKLEGLKQLNIKEKREYKMK